ncbi:MAG: DNA-protecting protein DprA [Clostridiales bacterium]|jgi:DNA processing protein|nr:DNA-protecting protein DprA [Clostridiales bacterium]
MASLQYWIWLTTLKGIGPKKAARLLDRFGTPEKIHAAPPEEFEEVRELNLADRQVLLNKSLDGAERILEVCARKNIEILTIHDTEYPERLKNIDTPPPVLYLRGKLPDIDDTPVIAIVGSRRSTPYGLGAAEKISSEISRGGGIVVSGMARGIDSAAHIGALNAGKPTAAVLGCGVDVCYPKENKRLMESIICTGAVISEYPPGTGPEASNFPPRNRIISGLSVGVVVIEAPGRSGSLITANYALEQNRDVFAVPGNIDKASNEGVNNLIKDGAKLVTSGEDVLCEYICRFPHRINIDDIYSRKNPGEQKTPERTRPDLDGILEKLREKISDEELTLVKAIGTDTPHIDEIIAKSGFPAQNALSCLTMLEIKGIVSQLSGKRFALSDKIHSGQQ